MHKMMVLAKAVPGRADELARWYDERHMTDLLAVPGLVSAERHTIMAVKKPEGTVEWDFMLIYELEGDEPMLVLRNMAAAQVPVVCDALDSSLTLSLIATSRVRRTG